MQPQPRWSNHLISHVYTNVKSANSSEFRVRHIPVYRPQECNPHTNPVENTTLCSEKALKHYKEHRIDPRTKTVVYSDALDLEGVRRIKEFVNGRLHDVYGIGTYLTNDVGVKPLNMVIKLFECKPSGGQDFLPTVKLSDVDTKHTGDPKEVDLCLRMLRLI